MSGAGLAPLHLGAFHTYEWVLFVLLLAGPFLGLAVTIVLVRRREAAEEGAAAGSGATGESVTPTRR